MKPELILGLLERLRRDALDRPVDLPVTVACPPRQRLLELAAGLVDDEAAHDLIGHAAQCDRCGGLLRRSLEDFNREASPEEEQFVAAVRSTPVREIPVRHLPAAATVNPPWRWVAAAAAAAFLIVGAWWMNRPVPAETLLAQAYSAERPFDARFPEATWAPPAAQRSAGSLHPSLAAAQLQIRDRLAVTPPDAHWLELKGRAELLAGQPGAAIDSLRQALALRPETPSILLYLAIAESQNALDDPSANTRALKYLTRAIQLEPSNAVAYFNRALVQNKLGQRQFAVKDWDKVIALEPGSDWAAEARRRSQ